MPNYGIFHEGLTAVDANMLRLFQRDQLVNQSDMCRVLDSMSLDISGPAGLALAITDAQGLPRGYHYNTGFEPAANYDIGPGPVKHFEDWSNFAVPVAISGTELSKVSGMTTREIINTYYHKDPMDIAEAHVYYDLLGKRYQDASDVHGQARGYDLWGIDFPTADIEGVEREMRRPATFKDIFDLDANVHGLEQDGLGTWNEMHPWHINGAPGDDSVMPSDAKQYVHAPRLYDANDSDLTQSLVNRAMLETSSIAGEWLCGLHSSIAQPLFQEFVASGAHGNDQAPVLIGYDQWRLEITSVRYQRCTFFVDDFAPRDAAYLIHVGTQRADERIAAGFQIVNWVPSDVMEEMSVVKDHVRAMTKDEPRGVRMGYGGMMPYWNDEFGRVQGREDASGTKIRRQWAQMCYYRWKHIGILNIG